MNTDVDFRTGQRPFRSTLTHLAAPAHPPRSQAPPSSRAPRDPTPSPGRSCSTPGQPPMEAELSGFERRPHRTGAGPGRSSHRPPGGVVSPRSGRRSPIRVLPGGQAAGCEIAHRRKPSAALPPGRFLIAFGAGPRRYHTPAPTIPNPSPARERQPPGIHLRGRVCQRRL